MTFKDKFLEYFNENIIHEPAHLKQEYKLEQAKFIFFYEEGNPKEVKRCYLSFIQFLTENKLSLDYLTKEMLECNIKEREVKVNGEMQFNQDAFIIVSPIKSRKPKQAKGAKFDITNVPVNFAKKFNTDYKIHKNKVSTYDTFELMATEGEIEDLEFFKKKFVEAFKKNGYTIWQIKHDLLEIQPVEDNNYLVRYYYEG